MGSYSLTVTVRDSNDGTAPAHLTYTVDPLPTVATPSASSASGVVGESIDLSAKATSGSGDLRYAWSGLPTGMRFSQQFYRDVHSRRPEGRTGWS